LAHLLTDFIFQPAKWIKSRRAKHFRSPHLYWHVAITALAALLLIGYEYWKVVLIILVTHLLIDGWKSYRSDKIKYFLLDQAFHLLVIIGCWYFTFMNSDDIKLVWEKLNTKNVWILATAFICVTQPAGIFIGQLTKSWRTQIPDGDSLGNAGKWIGIIERIIILALVLNHQYASVGLLLTAKSLLRFNEPNRLEVKTEYLLIGTLISFGIAALTGIVALQLTSL
jgi:uncharacterized membrane protein